MSSTGPQHRRRHRRPSSRTISVPTEIALGLTKQIDAALAKPPTLIRDGIRQLREREGIARHQAGERHRDEMGFLDND